MTLYCSPEPSSSGLWLLRHHGGSSQWGEPGTSQGPGLPWSQAGRALPLPCAPHHSCPLALPSFFPISPPRFSPLAHPHYCILVLPHLLFLILVFLPSSFLISISSLILVILPPSFLSSSSSLILAMFLLQVILCKDGEGKIGLRVKAVNKV